MLQKQVVFYWGAFSRLPKPPGGVCDGWVGLDCQWDRCRCPISFWSSMAIFVLEISEGRQQPVQRVKNHKGNGTKNPLWKRPPLWYVVRLYHAYMFPPGNPNQNRPPNVSDFFLCRESHDESVRRRYVYTFLSATFLNLRPDLEQVVAAKATGCQFICHHAENSIKFCRLWRHIFLCMTPSKSTSIVHK